MPAMDTWRTWDDGSMPYLIAAIVAAFAALAGWLARQAGPAAAAVAKLYDPMSLAEAAMVRRGPANSLRAEDRQLIEGWEGDAREAQRSLRASLEARSLRGWAALSARLHGRF